MKVPKGFLFNGLRAGIKKRNKDFGIIISQNLAQAAGFFTRNEFQSESVLVCKEHIKYGRAKAIIVNSGNANCARGKQGIKDAERLTEICAEELGVKSDEVLIASTGRIGVPLAYKILAAKIKELIQMSSDKKVLDFAYAIMTTDKFPKLSCYELSSGVRVLGIAKGAGMIEPDLATNLCFLLTDARLERVTLKKIIKSALDLTFNRISVDGEQSTNDTFICLANGASGVDIAKSKSNLNEFKQKVLEVLGELAYMIVENGEGATKVIKITVKNSHDEIKSREIARRIARSLLFKTSIYGHDANWGRIIAGIGSLRLGLGKDFDIYYGKVKVVKNGVSLYYNKKKADNYLKRNKEIEITVDLKKGRFNYWIYTTDLSPEYIEVNK